MEEIPEPPDNTPANILISPDTLSFNSFNETQVITATVVDEEGTEIPGVPLSWQSSNEQVVSFELRDNRSIRATSTGNGDATIEVSASGLTVLATIQVEQRVAGINFTPETPALEFPGDTLTVSGIARDAMGNLMLDAPLSWIAESSPTLEISAEALPLLETLNIPGIWLLGGLDRSIPSRLDSTNIGRLQSQGKPYDYIWYPDADHSLWDIEFRDFVNLWATYLDWMEQQGFK